MAIQDFESDHARAQQEEFRELYRGASSYVSQADAGHSSLLEVLSEALACARMYFWIRTFDGSRTLEGLTAEEIRSLLRHERMFRSFFKTPSIASLLVMLSDSLGLADRVTDAHIEAARSECLRSFARVKTYLLRLPADA